MLPLRKRQRIQVIEPPDVGPSRHHGVARSSNRTGETVALELRGGKGPLRAADVSLRNSSQAEEESEQDEDDLIAPAGLSTDDEQSRRRLFSIAQVPSRPSTSMPSGNRHSRRPSQASSDAQPLGNEATRFLSVRTPQRQRRPTRLYTSDDSDDGDDDSDEQGTRSSSVSNLQREELFSAQNGHEAPVPTFNMPSSQSYTTGMRQSFYMPSDEGDGSVPLTGTRASVEKLKRKRESLETPFKPPSGTRAAQLILSQQRQTDRN
ncbi:hypothetical protein BXZ70DRAFT_761660 [Cristinia sonorae]|uniref:Uncharacterized protein n=1 Tax=Cristinia sonorae TaxID=1940300 RepID=A0A8K0USA9_9AGAR|nr:hypothetical protein BXZ70DRAFT_761660 [Cristinia sonorae]